MINSENNFELLRTRLIKSDNFNAATSATRLHSNSLYKLISSRAEIMQSTLAGIQEQHQQSSLRQERVKVQHLENHTKLQNNNCWNNYLLSASSPGGGGGGNEMQEDKEFDLEVDDKTHTIYRRTKSAFTFKFDQSNIFSSNNNNNNVDNNLFFSDTETNNHQQTKDFFINGEPRQKSMMVILPRRRTEDQEHAYRRIECVHNYAKLKSYDDDEVDDQSSPNGEEDDEEDEDDDYEEEDDNNDADYDAEEDEMIDLDAHYEDIFNRRRFPKFSNSSTEGGSGGAPIIRQSTKKSHNFMASQNVPKSRENEEDADLQVEVDVETIEKHTTTNTLEQNSGGVSESAIAVKPDHHARRPMNAFLIFCKRHRAIVKERYKTLENRAITKILGDWWASLEISDKNCFTNLAQENKDAFFSANPNFKWYKLPAPPLRTLNTRPTNCTNTTGGGVGGDEYDDSSSFITNAVNESISNNTRSSTNYFKLADEAQMGDLSQLMQDKSKTKQSALQQALGETSQFMRSHITGSADAAEEKHQLKRRFYSENSFSSNSSEEDGLLPKKKSARSCKGKRYQELINSGQIAAPAVKKSKSSQRLTGDLNANHCLEMAEIELKIARHEEPGQLNNTTNNDAGAMGQKRCASELDNMFSYDLAGFDLEEKIKQLPALSLDDYLQRKRNTKKKKKFSTTGKKRGSRSNNSNNNSNSCSSNNNNECSASQSYAITTNTSAPISPTTTETVADAKKVQQKRQQQQQAVGSQKRKARKESITRRDVSAIEKEVASLLPLTINGCCYFQEASSLSLPPPAVTTSHNKVAIEKDTNSPTYTTVESFEQTSPIIPLTTIAASSSTPTVTVELLNNTLNDNIISSTSDLLILAEVAANRTELKH